MPTRPKTSSARWRAWPISSRPRSRPEPTVTPDRDRPMLRSLSAACLAAAVFLLAIAPAEAQRSRALRGEKAETLQVDVRNKTQPTLCAEDDNVYLTLTNRKVRH